MTRFGYTVKESKFRERVVRIAFSWSITETERNVALSMAVEGSRSRVAKNREDPRPIGKENGTRTVDILEAGIEWFDQPWT